ncbi:hypothetical protein [Terriglobus sp.]|uniref:hypothetical protein n=1 Tax=Terriglobus sp. TaxID=1889013 RepID=UPI003B001C02
MKHVLFSAALILGSLTAASAMAQAPAQDAAPTQHRHMHHDPHKQAMHLGKRLGLSADQTAKVEPILAQRRDQMLTIQQNTSLTPDQRKAQMHDLKRNTHQQLAVVLTPEQMQQWQAMRKQRHMQQQQGAPAPTGV